MVMFVGWEKVGISRSTRSLSGATGIRAGTIGCGIVMTVAPPEPVDVPCSEPDPLDPEGESALLSLVHAAATIATATPSTSSRRRTERSRRPSSPPSLCMTSSVARIRPGSVVVRAVLVVRPVVVGLVTEDPEAGVEPDLHHPPVLQTHLDPVGGTVIARIGLGHRSATGELERGLIFFLVMMDKQEAVAFLIAAKSIFRFGELKDRENRAEAEYITIGTLMSFTWGLVAAWTTWSLYRRM